PKATGKKLYILNKDLPSTTLAKLNNDFGITTWTMINAMKSMNGEEKNASEDTVDVKTMDMEKMYQLQPMLMKIPASVITQAREQALAMDTTMLIQSGTMMVGAFYRELGVDMAVYQSTYIIRIGIFMLLIALGGGLASVLVNLLTSRIAAGVARNLREQIFEKVTSFSSAEYDKFSTASLITRSTNDVMQIQMLLTMGIRMICYSPIMVIGGVIMALRKSTSMAWIIGAGCIVLIGFVMVIFAIVMPKFQIMQKLVDKMNLVARETLNGLMVIRAFGTIDFEKKRFDDANQDLAKTNLFVNRAMTFMMPIMMLIMNGISLLIIWVGAHYVASSAIQVGDMMAYMQYAMQIIMSFFMLSMMFVFLPRAIVSAERIAEILETKPSIVDPLVPKEGLPDKKGWVEFKNVSFRYTGADEDAVKDISFVAKPGETTAIIGSTGSGKSTLVNIIPRFYDATKGEVLVNGINVKEMTQKKLHSCIGYVPQKSTLLSGTIESNIKYGNDEATEDEMRKAAEVSQSLTFITEKENGFESSVSQGGNNVSGGQRQRLSIARALAVKPDVYIFDDSFSALDFKTDATLRKALNDHTGNSTVIIVAQRVGTIINADNIYVLNDGEILGHGTHKELLRTCEAYLEIASSQLSKEELEKAKLMMIILIFNLAITLPGGAFTAISNAYEKFVFPRSISIIKYI
ncbi:MAG: ABC transporter ATP-binding protein, partial [Oscillospiraceae bacterium]